MLLVKARSPLAPLMITGVVDIKDKLQSSQSFRVKALNATLEIVSSSLNCARPLERILHVLAERRTIHNKGLEFANEVR